jgi:aspartyl-tRNA(Asn)/glutamyl-tRNA(Gln) amidotransferase subunit C
LFLFIISSINDLIVTRLKVKCNNQDAIAGIPCMPRWYNTAMSLSEAEVRHIALLARLELTPEEIIKYSSQLSAILEHAGKLQDLDTRGIDLNEPRSDPGNPLREDEPSGSLTTQQVLKNAKQVEKDQFKVPPVLGRP